jgi:hypothetical protein
MDTEIELPEGIRASVPTLNVETTAEMLGYTTQHVNRLLLNHKLHGKKDAGHWRVSTRSIATELYWRTETFVVPLPSAAFGNSMAPSLAVQEQRLGLFTSKRAPRALLDRDGAVVKLIVPTDAEVDFWDKHLGSLAY